MNPLHSILHKLAYMAGLLVLGLLSACGSGGGSGGTSNVELATLSGFIHGSTPMGSTGLEGVRVSIESSQGTLSALTDANGTFIIPSIGILPAGSVHVEVDGSTALPSGPLAYPTLELMVPLVAGTTDLVLPQLIVLPDLNNLASANQNLPLTAGVATMAISVVQTGGLTDIALSGPVGTVITSKSLDGSEVGIDLNLTPVALAEVPMPLPDGWTAGDFVTIQPGSASFDPPGAAVGLNIVLPNSLGLALLTEVDIWSFDHDDGEWVNRSEQTGNRGMVVADSAPGIGSHIEANDVITEGGWHAAAVVVDVACATTFTGSVVDSLGAGIPNASIAFSTGQFTSTDSAGNFSSGLIPAYNLPVFQATEVCEAISIGVSVVLPPSLGGEISTAVAVDALDIVMAGVTVLAPFEFVIPNTGSLAGVVIGDYAPGETVDLTLNGGGTLSVLPNGSDAFFVSDLAAGAGTASFLFSGETVPKVAPFTIESGQIATVTLQDVPGTGNDDVTVLVLFDDDDNEYSDLIPVAGATVRLQGTDSASQAGLVMVTDANGEALFEDVTGPYTVTAQQDILVEGDVIRGASSLIGITPLNDTIGIVFFGGVDITQPVNDATVSGSINTQGMVGTVLIRAQEAGVDSQGFDQIGFLVDGNYSIPVPSGQLIDLSISLNDFNGGSQVLASIILPAVGTAPSGGTLDVDADLADAVLWNESLAVTVSGLEPGFVSGHYFGLSDKTGTEFEFQMAYDEGAAFTLMLPDLSAPGLLGFEGSVASYAEPSQGIGDDQQSHEVFFASQPSTIDVAFLGVATLVTPGLDDVTTAAQFESSTVTFLENSAGEISGGLNFIGFGTNDGPAPAGVDEVTWHILVPEGVTSFDLPQTALPMFEPGSDIYYEVCKWRLEGYNFDYSAFFSENFQAEWEQMTTIRTLEVESCIETNLELN